MSTPTLAAMRAARAIFGWPYSRNDLLPTSAEMAPLIDAELRPVLDMLERMRDAAAASPALADSFEWPQLITEATTVIEHAKGGAA